MATIDSYDSINQDNIAFLSTDPGGYIYIGQSFMTPNYPVYITDVELDIAKVGTVSGNFTISIAKHGGTYGTSSIPASPILKTLSYSTSAITTTLANRTYLFGTFANLILDPNTAYTLIVSYALGGGGILLGTDNSSPTHPGNSFYYNGTSYVPDNGADVIFYVNGTTATQTDKTQSGVIRLNNTLDKVQLGKTRISTITTKTQIGNVRIRKTLDKLQTGLVRIRKTVDKTQSGTIRIKSTIDRTQSGILRVKTTVNKTQTGLMKITTTGLSYAVNGYQGGVGSFIPGMQSPGGVLRSATISTVTDRTQTGVARIRTIVDKTQSGILRVKRIVDKTQLGIARINTLITKTTTGKMRVQVATNRTISGVLRVSSTIAITSKTISGVMRVRNTVTRTQTGIMNIVRLTTKTQIGKLSVSTSSTKTQHGIMRVYNPLIGAGIYIPKTNTQGTFESVELDDAFVYIPKTIETGKY